MIGYYIQASDGDIGHIEDFLVDDDSWAIRYVIVDTVNWWPGRKVVIAPQWIKDMNWADSRVYVNLTRARIKNAPEYDPSVILDREYEKRLYQHYDSPKYWDETTML